MTAKYTLTNHISAKNIKITDNFSNQILEITHEYRDVLQITPELCEHCRNLILEAIKGDRVNKKNGLNFEANRSSVTEVGIQNDKGLWQL